MRGAGRTSNAFTAGFIGDSVGQWLTMTSVQSRESPPTLKMLRSLRHEISSALQRHGGTNLRVFGSVARGDASPTSDIDMLVEMESGRSLLDLAALHLELEEIVGYPVEISTDVRPRLRERISAEAVVL